MNERIRELAEQATERNLDWDSGEEIVQIDIEKFADLIVRECIEQGKQVQSQNVHGSKDYIYGREIGIEVFMNQIKKHFGVEE